jgi:membrane protein
VLDVLGFARTDFAGWALTVLGQLLLVVLDTVIFTLLFHRLCGVSLPWGDLATGGFIAAIGFTLLKLFASELLQGVSRNRFLASFGVIVGLLVWMNLVARLLLVSAAWSATVAQDRGHLRTPDPSAQAGEDGEAPVADGEEPPDTARPEPVRRHRGRLALAASFAAGALASRLLSRRGDREDAGD